MLNHSLIAERKTIERETANVTITGSKSSDMTVERLNHVFIPPIFNHHSSDFIPIHFMLARTINGENAITSHKYHTLIINTIVRIASGIRYARPITVLIIASVVIAAVDFGMPI